MADEPVSDFDAFVAQRKAARLTDSMNQGITRQPVAAAESLQTAKELDLPVDTVERNPEQARRQRALAKLDAMGVVRDSPSTAKFLSDPDNAAVAHDDVQSLRDIERISSQILTISPQIGATLLVGELVDNSKNASYLGRKAVSGMRYGVPAAVAGGVAAVSEMGDDTNMATQRQMADAYLRNFRQAHLANPPPLSRQQWDQQVSDLVRSGRFKVPARAGSVAEAALNEREAILRDQADYVGPTDDIGRMTQMVGSGLESVGTNALPLLASMLVGNPAPMLVGGSLTTGGLSYGEARSQGAEPSAALPYALRDTLIEGGTEYLPGVRLFRDLKAGSPIIKTMINNQLGEQLGEAAATTLQGLNAWNSLPENAGKPITEYLAGLPEDLLQTAVATLVASGLQAGVAGGVNAVQQRMNQSALEQSSLDDLLNTAKSSKLRAVDPERFDQFLQSSVGSHTVYVAQDQVAKLRDEGIVLSPEIERQLDGSGGDVAVSMRDVLRNPEIAVKLRGHIRMSPDGMTTDELKDGGKTLVRDMLARAQNQTIDDTEWSLIKQQVTDQLKASGRYNADDASKAAELIPAYVDRVVKQYGLTPMEVFKRMNLDIRGPNTPAPPVAPTTTLDQDAQFDFSLPTESNQLRDYKIGDTTISLDARADGIKIASVRTPGTKRGQGSARAAMTKLIRQADKQGTVLTLDASPLDKKTKTVGLVEFYRSLGFEPTGRTINQAGDIEMVRQPADQDVAAAGATPDTLEDARREWEINGTASPYFKQWFGDSKVVDEKGAPLVVYHGGESGIESFDTNRVGTNMGQDREGFFFTNDRDKYPGSARSYADIVTRGGGKGQVYPTYLDIKNPYTLQQYAADTGVSVDDLIYEQGDPQHPMNALDVNRDDVFARAKAGGYDGIVFENAVDGMNDAVYVAFKPEQIKSATGNRGTFDRSNPSILAQGIKLSEDVTVAETGETVTIEQDAERVIEQTRKRLEMLKRVARCLGK